MRKNLAIFLTSLLPFFALTAVAQSPQQRQVILGGHLIRPAFSENFLAETYPLSANFTSNIAYSNPSLGGLVTGPDGLLTYKPNNLLTYSNSFSDAAWGATRATFTTGIADPFGGTNATTMTATSAFGVIQQDFFGVPFPAAINTIWARRRTGTGAVTYSSPDHATNTLALTSSWKQFAGAAAPNSGEIYVQFVLASSGDAVDIYAATVSAVTHETTPRIQDQVITTSAAYFGVPLDYDPITHAALGPQVWEARTNVALWNRDLTNAVWSKSNITAAKDQTGVDGVANSASSIVATAGNGAVLQAITLASSTRFQSVYVQRITGTGVVNMTTDGGSTWTAITVPSGSWGRVNIPTQTLANPSIGFQIVTSGDKIAVDLVQNENGANMSPPKPTAASAVAASADVYTLIGAAATAYKAASMSAIVEFDFTNPLANTPVVLSSTGDYRDLLLSSGGLGSVKDGGSTLAATTGVAMLGGIARIGMSETAASRSVTSMGAGLVSDTNQHAAGATVYLGSDLGTGNWIDGHLRSLALYNPTLIGAKLQLKSAVGARY